MISDNQPDISLSKVTFEVSNHFVHQAIQQWHLHIPSKLENAVLKRKAEFLAGRRAAQLTLKQALAKGSTHKQASFEYPNSELPQLEQDQQGRPLWPEGFVGSISHSTSTYHNASVAIACAAPADQYSSLGIDIEHWVKAETAEKLSPQILLEQEKRHLAHEVQDITTLFTLVFAAKESLYKLLNPLTDVFFGFQDAKCTLIDLASKRIELALMTAISDDFPTGTRFSGNFEFFEHSVLCLLSRPADVIRRK